MFSLFGGKDPFDDPFFTSPFDMFRTQTDSGHRSRDITIEEVDSDGNPLHHSEPSKELVVRDPNSQIASKRPNGKNGSGSKSFSFRRVAYGGLNGIYYTASVTRKSGDDGVSLIKINEEDKAVGESLNTISKGIRDRGSSITTKRTSDGKFDTVRTLNNLNEDELVEFEETWNANAQKLPPDWTGGPNLLENAEAAKGGWDWWPTWGGWALPSTEPGDSDGKTKKIVPVTVE